MMHTIRTLSSSSPRALALALILTCTTLLACGDDDGTTGPGGGGGDMIDVTIRATQLVVEFDCDAATGDPSIAAGDFYMRVSLLDANDEVLSESRELLIQLHDGESAAVPELAATASVPFQEAQRVKAVVSYYENDGGGSRVTAADTMTFAYDADSGCWTYAGDSVCLGRSGQITVGRVILRDISGDPCAAELHWSFSVASE